jgi:hypothetical protein
MEHCAHHFAAGVAYGKTTGQASTSFVVESLNDFISHSWRASRWLKYFAFILLYNNHAALCMCAFFSSATFVFWMLSPDNYDQSPIKSHCIIVGFLAYQCGLHFYQRIRQLLCLSLRVAFLDKLCIDQSDAVRQQMGIRSLNTFLACSSRMVILWDRTYFTRAWCVFEVAMRERFFRTETVRKNVQTRRRSRVVRQGTSESMGSSESVRTDAEAPLPLDTSQESKTSGGSFESGTVVIPLQLALTIGCVCLQLWFCNCTFGFYLSVSDNFVVDSSTMMAIGYVSIVMNSFVGAGTVMAGRQYARDMHHLDIVLERFSWQNTLCLDQDDHTALSTLLVHWFGSVAEFDMFVSGRFKNLILQQVGGEDRLIFYSWTLPACMAIFCGELDFVLFSIRTHSRDFGGYVSLACGVLATSFCGVPLGIKIYMQFCVWFRSTQASCLCEALVNVMVWAAAFSLNGVIIGAAYTLDWVYRETGNILIVVGMMLYRIIIVILCIGAYTGSFKEFCCRLGSLRSWWRHVRPPTTVYGSSSVPKSAASGRNEVPPQSHGHSLGSVF